MCLFTWRVYLCFDVQFSGLTLTILCFLTAVSMFWKVGILKVSFVLLLQIILKFKNFVSDIATEPLTLDSLSCLVLKIQRAKLFCDHEVNLYLLI